MLRSKKFITSLQSHSKLLCFLIFILFGLGSQNSFAQIRKLEYTFKYSTDSISLPVGVYLDTVNKECHYLIIFADSITHYFYKVDNDNKLYYCSSIRNLFPKNSVHLVFERYATSNVQYDFTVNKFYVVKELGEPDNAFINRYFGNSKIQENELFFISVKDFYDNMSDSFTFKKVY